MRSTLSLPLLLLLAGSVPGRPAAAASLPGALPGTPAEAEAGLLAAERFRFHADLAPGLLKLAPEDSVRVDDWPVAPGVRKAVTLARHDVYAADARIVAIDGGREVEVPRSRLVFFWGSVEGDATDTIVAWVDPDTLVVGGSAMTRDGSFDLQSTSPLATTYRVVARDPAAKSGGPFSCGADSLPTPKSREPLSLDLSGPQKLISSLHYAVIAVDTDNEFMNVKFGNNTTNAANFVAQLIAGMNAMYERDLFVRLLQGYTILRVSTTADPYVQNVPGGADVPEIEEVASYWSANYGGIRRAVVILLSGRSAPGFASGIASVGALCSTANGYSFNEVFTSGTIADADDFGLVGHEIGHNFGSFHTHCTDTSAAAGLQPIDFCNSQCAAQWNPNPGANSCPAPFTIDPVNGAPVTGVRGTLMSYCHLLSGCSTAAQANIFHPQTVGVLSPFIDAALNQCVFPAGNLAPTVSAIAATSGSTGGGVLVTITGANFRSPATVAFGDLARGVAATSVTVVSGNTITAITPAHAAGVTDVVVMNPDHQTGTLRNGYTFTVGPAVTAVSPNSGPTTGGTGVAISGSSFAAPATVTFGGAAATAVNVVNSSTITAVTPAHATGTVAVSVTVPGPLTATNSAAFFYVPLPVPSRFFPVAPCRLVDTREPAGAPTPLLASARRNFTLTGGPCAVPSTAKALSLNVTITSPTLPGHLILFPGNGLPATTSNINFAAGQTRANNAVVMLATDGTGSLGVQNGSAGTVHFILDVNGYFQ